MGERATSGTPRLSRYTPRAGRFLAGSGGRGGRRRYEASAANLCPPGRSARRGPRAGRGRGVQDLTFVVSLAPFVVSLADPVESLVVSLAFGRLRSWFQSRRGMVTAWHHSRIGAVKI